MSDSVIIYTDGSCLGNPGPGGWGVVILWSENTQTLVSGSHIHTTNNRMEVTAAIKGLEAVPAGTTLDLYSDSRYLVYTMSRNWRRQANLDLWQELAALVLDRHVVWHWVKGHTGDHWNTEADRLAQTAAQHAKNSLEHME